jgi:dihydrofolate synthase/folylpolyglutamate synthase
MHETIDWLYGLQHFGIKLGLDNIRALLDACGRPQGAFRSIHVAGTNGKGSVAAMVDALLASSGVAAGLFTSPHLVRPNERIRLAGRDIESEELHVRLRGMRETIEQGLRRGALAAHPSFFEVVTATALTAFRDHRLEAGVLEVGLGGRLDATNAVDADVGVIVSIGHDHVKTLGPTLPLISAEKAGIIKPGMPVVSGVTQQSAIEVVRRVCRERGARWVDARLAARLVREDGESFTLVTDRHAYEDLRLSTAGRHQIDNARVALVGFERLMATLGREPDPTRVRAGFAEVRWPGRLQWWTPADGGPRILFDAAHNPAGIQALARHLRAHDGPRPVLVFGATSGKPLDRLLAPLASLVERAVITRPKVERGLDAEEVAAEARRWMEHVETEPEPAAALERARELASPDRYVLVAGSLYLVGQVLALQTAEATPGPIAM